MTKRTYKYRKINMPYWNQNLIWTAVQTNPIPIPDSGEGGYALPGNDALKATCSPGRLVPESTRGLR